MIDDGISLEWEGGRPTMVREGDREIHYNYSPWAGFLTGFGWMLGFTGLGILIALVKWGWP